MFVPISIALLQLQLQSRLQIKRPVLLVGEAGTSKTATIMQYLRNLNPSVNVIEKSL